MSGGRVVGTGAWIVNNPTFVDWRDNPEAPHVLWAHGPEGSGKSVLTSHIIDHLMAKADYQKTSTAFVYFDYQNRDRQAYANVVRCLLRQLADSFQQLPGELEQCFRRHNHATTPVADELERISTYCVPYDRVMYVVVDAVDECSDGDQYRLCAFLGRLSVHKSVRLLITSRGYPQVVGDEFGKAPQIEVAAHPNDIELFVDNAINTSASAYLIDDELASTIRHNIVRNSQGSYGICRMLVCISSNCTRFLLPKLQMEGIRREYTPEDMERASHSLSTDLPSAFQKTLARIRTQHEGARNFAINALMWVAYAQRPLTMVELGSALAVRLGQTMPPTERQRLQRRTIIELCYGLLETDETREGHVCLVHYTLQDYLEQHSDEIFGDAQARLAETCIKYLSYQDFQRAGPCHTKVAIEKRLSGYPLLPYAAAYWAAHVRGSQSIATTSIATKFLGTHVLVANTIQTDRYCKRFVEEYWRLSEVRSTDGVHLAAGSGMTSTLSAMLETDKDPIDRSTKIGTTPLIRAASAGHVDTTRFLLARGADPWKENMYGECSSTCIYPLS